MRACIEFHTYTSPYASTLLLLHNHTGSTPCSCTIIVTQRVELVYKTGVCVCVCVCVCVSVHTFCINMAICGACTCHSLSLPWLMQEYRARKRAGLQRRVAGQLRSSLGQAQGGGLMSTAVDFNQLVGSFAGEARSTAHGCDVYHLYLPPPLCGQQICVSVVGCLQLVWTVQIYVYCSE